MKKVYQIPKIKEENLMLDDIILLSTVDSNIDIGTDPLKEVF